MSQKGRLRRLERGVEWLETEGRFRRIEIMFKILDMKQQIADRLAVDPAAAAQWKKDYPNFPCELPPPSPHLRRPAASSPPEPQPVIVPESPLPKVETPPPPPPPPVLSPPPPPAPLPKPVPSPMGGQPVAFPSPHMEIRPVRWGPREAQDDDEEEEERPGTNGRCITEYDVLRDKYDDEA